MRPLQDRVEAGQLLAQHLKARADPAPVVLGLPRGGVVCAYEVAVALDAPLDVVVARKLGAPRQPELAIGAIAPGGIELLDRTTVSALGITQQEIKAIARREREEMERRLDRYRGDAAPVDVRGRTAILVDDGVATGMTSLAAIRSVRKREPAALVLAVGACSQPARTMLEKEVDAFLAVLVPKPFRAVGYWFLDFGQTTDAEVADLLARARR